MIVGIVVLLALGLRSALGCSLRSIGDLRVRGEAFLLAVFVTVFALPLASTVLHPPRAFVLPVWIGLMAALAYLSIVNGSLNHGFRVMAVGVGSNLVVIALNGGMPVSREAVMSVGGAAGAAAVAAGDVFHSVASSSTRLALLSDVLPLPGFPGLRGIVSIGDLLMFVGIVIVVVTASKAPGARAATARR